MSLEEIYYVSQIVAVVGIFASLVFVGLQIRQNTRATRAASHNAVSDSLNEINRMFAENADLTKIWLTGMADRATLSPEEAAVATAASLVLSAPRAGKPRP